MLKFFVVFTILLMSPALVGADNHGGGSSGNGGGDGSTGPDCPPDAIICNPLPFNTIPEVINTVINFIAALAGPVAVIMIVYAAYLFILGGTNPEQVKKARSIILYTVIGIAVVVMSKAIVKVTCSILSASC